MSHAALAAATAIIPGKTSASVRETRRHLASMFVGRQGGSRELWDQFGAQIFIDLLDELDVADAEVRRQRAYIQALQAEYSAALAWFQERGYPGRQCVRTGWIDETWISERRERLAACMMPSQEELNQSCPPAPLHPRNRSLSDVLSASLESSSVS